MGSGGACPRREPVAAGVPASEEAMQQAGKVRRASGVVSGVAPAAREAGGGDCFELA
uniref:DUF834 domain-containing protein n=1 Tax=Oryza meridionalis TaxID=40149 RepID=A0A0E0FC56_9ORYZ